MIAPRKRLVNIHSKYFGISDSFDRITPNKNIIGSRGSLGSLWREPRSIDSVFATLTLSLFFLYTHCNFFVNLLSLQYIFHRLLRAWPCKNRPLKFSWKMDCLHFFYASQATYAMNENGLYFDWFAFLIFWGIFLYEPWKPHKPEIETPKIGGYVMLAQKLCTFNETTQFFQNHGIILSSFHAIKDYLLILNASKVMTF